MKPKKQKNKITVYIVMLSLLIPVISYGQTKVFILSGQSNMSGLGFISELTADQKAQYFQNTGNIDIFYYEGVNVNPPNTVLVYQGKLNSETGTFGPEIGIAKELAKRFPNEKLVFIKVPWAGSGLTDWMDFTNPNQPSPKTDYNWFQGRVNDAMKLISEPKILSGMFWMQGETDASNETNANNYANHLKALVDYIRSDNGLGVPVPAHLPFVYGEIQNALTNTGDRIWPFGSKVQSQQIAAQYMIDNVFFSAATADPNATVWPLTSNSDNRNVRHYNTNGQLYVGTALGNAMVQLLPTTWQYPNSWNFGQPSTFFSISGDFNNDGKLDFARLSSTCYFILTS
jgi:hypothetical protein